MTTVAMPLTNKITVESSKTAEFVSIEAQFGDGYRQAAAEGLNAKKDSWDVVWSALTAAEVTTIETALDSVGVWGIITWTPCQEAVQKKFQLQKPGYSRTRNKSSFSIRCQLKQVFDL